MIDNPLLDAGDRPAFDRIRPDHIETAVDVALEAHRIAMDAVRTVTPRTFASVALAREIADAELTGVWSLVGHLKSVIDSPELRAAHDAVQPRMLEYFAELGQDAGVFAALEAVRDAAPGPVERRAVDLALREFRLSGVALPVPQRRRFADVSVELGQLSNAFGEAVLDATSSWTLEVSDETLLRGVPAAEKAMLAAAAREAGREGWLLTLHAPSIRAIMTFAEDRGLRAQVYRAAQTRASDEGPQAGRFDNSDRMRRILALRQEKASLLGFDTPVELSLEPKMAATADEALGFLRDIAAQARPFAEAELEAARAFARRALHLDILEPWDMAFVSEKMRQALHALDEAEIKPYLPASRVVTGLIALLNEVFGVTLTEVEGVAVWHPDVRYYELSRDGGEPFAGAYFDLYARAGKNGGAWMDICKPRLDLGEVRQAPIAYLVCNFSPPDDDGVSLLNHNDLLTLLHEMGHCLHHLFGEVGLPSIGSISGFEWDAVELPSQLMENFGWDARVLASMSGHIETGQPMPGDLVDRMLKARGFQAGLAMLRQIEFSVFDLELHLAAASTEAGLIADTIARVRSEIAVSIPPSWTRFAHSFNHIFAGGYAAGYYSYLWAERLSADGFEQFEEAGYREAGNAFRAEVLSRGASRPAAESYLAFRGRQPSNAALLRFRGLQADEARAA